MAYEIVKMESYFNALLAHSSLSIESARYERRMLCVQILITLYICMQQSIYTIVAACLLLVPLKSYRHSSLSLFSDHIIDISISYCFRPYADMRNTSAQHIGLI